MDKRRKHYEKVKDILTSCKNRNHLKTAVKIVNQFTKQYKVGENDEEYINLKQLLGLMKIKCRVGDEENLEEDLSSSGSAFKTQAGLSGVPSLQSLKFEGEDKIEGGVADDMTPEDLAKKHNVRLKDIVDEIKVGKEIEKEHSNSESTAEEIAMDHIEEFPDYYSNKKYGVKTSEVGLKKDLDDEEEIEESSTAGGSGSFVPPLGGQPIKREIYKTNVPVTGAGGMNTPISKIRSFKKSQLKEVNVITKKEILESTDSGSNMVYDSPGGWGNNTFMGTKSKKGNAVQRKGNDHKKTYDYDTGSSTFVKVKDKCKKFPYCNQDANAVEYSKSPFSENEDKPIKSRIPRREDLKTAWVKFVTAARREGKETVIAAKILKKVLQKKVVSEEEYVFLKSQSLDIAKIFAVLTMGVITTALPIVLEKLLNVKGISIMPKEQTPLVDDVDGQEIIESICKKTGKSKKYVHSLINKYL